MRIIGLTLICLTIFISCKQETAIPFDINTFPKAWVRLTVKNDKLIIYNSCDAGNLLLTISKKDEKFKLLLHGQQEDYDYEILESTKLGDTVFIKTKWTDSDTKQDFKFFWTNKGKGLGRWITAYFGGKTRDYTFVLADRQNDFEKVDQPCRECWGDECDEIEKEKPILTIKKVFDDYIKNQESTDSQDDEALMTKSIESLNNLTDQNELDILINVWMYYDPTDFPSRNLVYKILENSRPESIKAVKTRIINKKEWETVDTAPYSELKDLLDQLDN